MNDIGLTGLSRHGGCSCKLDASSLEQLCSLPEVRSASIAGQEADDAAILPIGDNRVLVTSIDFQNPIVDDALTAGEIAAWNAMSDIYACGVEPMHANVVLILPFGDRSVEIGKELMRGVARACAAAGCAIVGGHTIQGEAPVVGLSVSAIAPLAHVKRKSGAQAGDVLMLTKPVGSGIAIAARQLGAFGDADFTSALAVLRHPNRLGARLGRLAGVTAMTDVTGFGLLGHLCEIAENSRKTITLSLGRVPFLSGAATAAREGAVPILADSNLNSYQARVRFGAAQRRHERLLLCDPQTNGGLLIAVRPDAAGEVARLAGEDGLHAEVIGSVGERDGVLVDVVA